MRHVWEKGAVHTGVRWGNLRERTSVDWKIILRWILRKWDAGAWIGLIWRRIGTSGGFL